MTYREAPEGWYQFGTHVDAPGVPLEFSTETDEAGMPLWERPMARLYVPARDLKMLREALCRGQHFIGAMLSYKEAEAPMRRIGDLIAQIDKHRPLGKDGNHGDLHTPTCGCEDR